MSKQASSGRQLSNRRVQWDAGRFLSTLGYFGEIPFIGSFRWLQQVAGMRVAVPGITMTADKKVAVIGEVSSEIAASLEAQLAPVALTVVRLGTADAEIDSLEIGQLMRSLDAAVIFSVQGLETFTAALKALSASKDLAARPSKLSQLSRVEQSVIDFTDPACDLSAWGALDDVVMGGVSEGSFFLRQSGDNNGTPREGSNEVSQYAVFAGNISTDNSGGFSSVRTQNFEPPFSFSGWQGMRLRVKGDGQRYKFILRNSSGWDSPAYIYSFDTTVDEWETIFVPFAEMVPTFRAKSMPDAPRLNSRNIVSIQLMLSKFEYDQQLNPNFHPGSFELAIANIGIWRDRQNAPLLIVSDQTAQAQQKQALEAVSIDYEIVTVADTANAEVCAKAIAQALSESSLS